MLDPTTKVTVTVGDLMDLYAQSSRLARHMIVDRLLEQNGLADEDEGEQPSFSAEQKKEIERMVEAHAPIEPLPITLVSQGQYDKANCLICGQWYRRYQNPLGSPTGYYLSHDVGPGDGHSAKPMIGFNLRLMSLYRRVG